MLNSQRDYLKKRMDIVRLLSLPAAQTAIVKRLGKKGERRKRRFWIRPGRTSAWWDDFVSEIVLPEEWRKNLKISHVSIMRLAEELRPYIEGKDTIMRTSIDVLKQVAMTLYYLSMAKPSTIEPVSCSTFVVNLFICNDCCLSMSSIFSRSRCLIATSFCTTCNS